MVLIMMVDRGNEIGRAFTLVHLKPSDWRIDTRQHCGFSLALAATTHLWADW